MEELNFLDGQKMFSISSVLMRNTVLWILDILFSSNHNIHKSSCGLCFWASDPLLIDFTKIFQLKCQKSKNNGQTNFYECCDLTKKVYLKYILRCVLHSIVYHILSHFQCLHSMKILPYFWNKKTQIVFAFQSMQKKLSIRYGRCPDLMLIE